MTKLPSSAIPVRLISQGRISKRDSQDIFRYRYADGTPVDFSRQSSTGYWNVKGRGKGETIFRIPQRKAWVASLEFTSKGRKNTYRVYLFTQIEKEAEARQLLKDIWTTRTNFPADFQIKQADIFSDTDDDQVSIMSSYSYGSREYEYEDKFKVRTTSKSVVFQERLHSDKKQHEDMGYNPNPKGAYKGIQKNIGRVGRKK